MWAKAFRRWRGMGTATRLFSGAVFVVSLGARLAWGIPEFPDLYPDPGSMEKDKNVKMAAANDTPPAEAAPVKSSGPAIASDALDELEKALGELRGLDAEDRKKLLSQVQGLRKRYDMAYITIKSASREDGAGDGWTGLWELFLTDKLGLEDEAGELAQKLRGKYFSERIAVNKCLFCSSVTGFGRYKELPAPIESGKSLIIYAEIEGLSQKLDGGWHQSQVSASFDIRDEGGAPVSAVPEPQNFTDRAQSQLRDYFLFVGWKPVLSPGKYKLTIKVKNGLFNQMASRTVAFSVI